LTDDVLRNITRLKLNKIRKRIWENYNAKLELADDVIEAIVKRCTEVDTGARNIDKIVNKTLLPELSINILQKMAAGESFHTVHVNVGSDGNFVYELQ
jgi:type VI secretion system protein VasG